MANCGDLLLITLGLQISGITISYSLALQQTVFTPSLPFISQAVTCNSVVSGVFSIFMIPSSFIGIIFCFIYHILPNSEENDYMKYAKSAASYTCMLYFLSWILICTFPFTFTDLPSKYEWVITVLIQHMIGACFMLASCIIFVVSQALLCSNEVNSLKSCFCRRILAFVAMPIGLIGTSSLIVLGFEELSCANGQSMTNIIYHLPTKLTTTYLITSICEWTLIICMWSCLMSLHEDMKNIYFRITLTHLPHKAIK